METVESAIKHMSKCCYMSSIDLRDAYYSIPIAPEFLLRFFSQCLLPLDANLDFHVWATEMIPFTLKILFTDVKTLCYMQLNYLLS